MDVTSKGLLLVISGPSGCGKGTVCRRLREKHPEIKVSVSVTTREMRANEIEGQDYFYTSKEKFEEMIQEGELLEHAQIYSGHYYGTPKKFVRKPCRRETTLFLKLIFKARFRLRSVLKKACLFFWCRQAWRNFTGVWFSAAEKRRS